MVNVAFQISREKKIQEIMLEQLVKIFGIMYLL